MWFTGLLIICATGAQPPECPRGSWARTVIVFWHIPKTGGSTIGTVARQVFGRGYLGVGQFFNSNVSARRLVEWRALGDLLRDHVTSDHATFVEVHDDRHISWPEMARRLPALRHEVREHLGWRLVFVTLLRCPLERHLSEFSYLCYSAEKLGRWQCPSGNTAVRRRFLAGRATALDRRAAVAHLLRTERNNTQSDYLLHSYCLYESSCRSDELVLPGGDETLAVVERSVHHFDIVGRSSNETAFVRALARHLPNATRVAFERTHASTAPVNVHPHIVQRQDFTDTEYARVVASQSGDTAWFSRVFGVCTLVCNIIDYCHEQRHLICCDHTH